MQGIQAMTVYWKHGVRSGLSVYNVRLESQNLEPSFPSVPQNVSMFQGFVEQRLWRIYIELQLSCTPVHCAVVDAPCQLCLQKMTSTPGKGASLRELCRVMRADNLQA